MTRITNPDHSLTLGGLLLVDNGKPVTHAAGFTTAVYADGTGFGKSEPVIRAIMSLLRAGSRQRIERWQSRPVTVRVELSATTIGALNEGEKALNAVVGIETELRWQPPAPGAPVTVFDVETSSMEFTFDDMSELRLTRSYTVTISAYPWPRSATKIITPAVTAVAPTVVDDGAATTNWTAPYGPTGATVTVVTGAVTVTYDASLLSSRTPPYYGTALRRTATFSTTTSKYVGVDCKSSAWGAVLVLVNGSSTFLTEVRREPASVAGFTRYWFHVGDVTSVTSLEVLLDSKQPGSGTQTFNIDQVLLANALPASGTTRQKISTITPGGSVPAEGTVLVQHATAGLGQAVVYTHRAGGGYTPPLRQWKSSGAADSVDTLLVSGAFTALSENLHFSVPWSAIPTGDTQLWVRAYRNLAATVRLSWSAAAVFPGFASPVGDQMAGALDFAFPAAAWQMIPLGRFVSPPTQLGGAGQLRIGIGAAGDAAVVVDEAWLFAMDEGVLTVVDNFTGTGALGGAANRLRVAAPSLDEPQGALMAGYKADWSDSHTATANNVKCDQVSHRFDPAGQMIFTVTSGTLDAAVSLEHFPRWHSNAGS